jgi:hypothetical protein
MKNIFALLLVAGLISFTSCKNDGAAKDDTRESLATTGNTASPDAPTLGTTPDGAADPSQGTVAETVPVGPTTTIEFAETTYDFGTIKDGEKATHMYKFTNTGSEPLLISNAKGSCGCTVPDWPREPIAPGASSEIKVVFDSKGKGSVEGQSQSKRVTLTANTDPVNTYLNIKGTVKKDAPAQ